MYACAAVLSRIPKLTGEYFNSNTDVEVQLCIDFMHVAAATPTFKYTAFLRNGQKHDSGLL